jgi:hypothetical protein
MAGDAAESEETGRIRARTYGTRGARSAASLFAYLHPPVRVTRCITRNNRPLPRKGNMCNERWMTAAGRSISERRDSPTETQRFVFVSARNFSPLDRSIGPPVQTDAACLRPPRPPGMSFASSESNIPRETYLKSSDGDRSIDSGAIPTRRINPRSKVQGIGKLDLAVIRLVNPKLQFELSKVAPRSLCSAARVPVTRKDETHIERERERERESGDIKR